MNEVTVGAMPRRDDDAGLTAFRRVTRRVEHAARELVARGILLLAAMAGPSLAQTCPSRPILWVVPFPPGGIADLLSRAMSRRMGEVLGQPFVIENRPGAGGSLATEQFARMAPEGHAVLYASSGTMAANLALYKSIGYDPSRDFAPVHGMVLAPLILVTQANRTYRSVPDLVDHAKAKPGAVPFGSAGAGTGTHLSGAIFRHEAG